MNKPLSLQQFIPEQTIQCYLDALLQDAAADLELAEVSAESIPVVVAAPVVVPAVELIVREVQTPAPLDMDDEWEKVAEHDAQGDVPVQKPDCAWREQPFEALLFEVGGLKLAVPLVSLGTIHSLDSEITPLFGQPDWFLGILPTNGGNLKVLDTARWVMPERYAEELKDNLRFVISVQGHDWGMAVHGVSKSIKLTPDQIKWRSQQGKRPWLAGTVIEHMCALLDVSALAGLLVTGASGKPAGNSVAMAERRQ